MGGLLSIGLSTLLSGGILSHGTIGGYISDSARRTLGLGLSHFGDGNVFYLSKGVNLLERGLIQMASQLAYGALRSYPRYLKYWEQRVRDQYLQTRSQSSLANETGQYYRLIEGQKAVARKKNYTDSVVGNVVSDYLELSAFIGKTISEGSITDPGLELTSYTDFVDLQPQVQVSSKNNVVLTTVQGRDFTRKELVSGGDYEISVIGKITSKYPDVYPEAEVSKFLKLMQFRGVINCDNTILRQFNITQIIVLNYSLGTSPYRNIQPYALSCVAVEPSEAVEVKMAEAEAVDTALKHTNKWIKVVKLGAEVIDPAVLMNFSPWV